MYIAYSPILDAQEHPQTSQGNLAAFMYDPVFRCSCLVSSLQTRPASNCWTEVLQCDRQSDRSSTSSSSSGGAMSQRFKLALSACPYTAFAVHRENVCLPPIHCRKWPLVICYHPCTAHGQSSEVEP